MSFETGSAKEPGAIRQGAKESLFLNHAEHGLLNISVRNQNINSHHIFLSCGSSVYYSVPRKI